VAFPPDVRRAVMYGPDGTFYPEALARATTAPAPFEEIDNAYEPWAEELPVLGPRLTVPLSLSSAEHEHFWIITPETVAALAAVFPNAPWVETPMIPGAGHNIDHHLVGRGFNLRRISFAQICGALGRTGRDVAMEPA
jgi:hypothetical protein